MVKPQVKGYTAQADSSGPAAADGTCPSSAASSATVASDSPSPSLKRPRSQSITIPPNTMNLPALPQLSGDIILEVFTHKSLRFAGVPSAGSCSYGDNGRLAVLGSQLLATAITLALFHKKPMLSAEEIEAQKGESMSDTTIDTWVTAYKLREKVRCTQDSVLSLQELDETRQLFCSYVGAVYLQQGMQSVQNWIGALIDPDYASNTSAAPSDTENYAKRLRNDQMGVSPPPFLGATYTSIPPPPPMNAPPPLPGNPLSPAQPQAAFLPIFNQTANQRRMSVEYPAQFSGPPHAGIWTVQCIVDGIQKGTGHGSSKQLAKEEAARQAYFAMGWAPFA